MAFKSDQHTLLPYIRLAAQLSTGRQKLSKPELTMLNELCLGPAQLDAYDMCNILDGLTRRHEAPITEGVTERYQRLLARHIGLHELLVQRAKLPALERLLLTEVTCEVSMVVKLIEPYMTVPHYRVTVPSRYMF